MTTWQITQVIRAFNRLQNEYADIYEAWRKSMNEYIKHPESDGNNLAACLEEQMDSLRAQCKEMANTLVKAKVLTKNAVAALWK